MAPADDNTVAAVEKAITIVEQLQTLERAGVTEIAESVGMPASTVYNYLQTLEKRKYVKQDGDQYRLANRFVHIGNFAKHRLPIYRVGKSNVVWLADETEKTVNLVIEEFNRGIYLMSENRERSLRNYSHVRRREYLHSTAVGKAILMAMSDDEIEAVIESEGLVQQTDRTITDPDELFEDIDRARERGYAINYEENTDGILAVGAPIENPDGPYAAVSVSGLVSRHAMEDVHDDLAPLVEDAAKAIQVELQS